jgi:hypothetical protein
VSESAAVLSADGLQPAFIVLYLLRTVLQNQLVVYIGRFLLISVDARASAFPCFIEFTDQTMPKALSNPQGVPHVTVKTNMSRLQEVSSHVRAATAV